jgi:hypothetical protein
VSVLIIRLTRISPTHHRFEAIRPDGTRTTRELETRSFLLHDLVHMAVENEAGLAHSFFGALTRGEDNTASAEAAMTERVVGALQGALKTQINPADFVARFSAYQRAIGDAAPDWLTAELVARVLERLRALQGRWRATPFHEALELRFDVD